MIRLEKREKRLKVWIFLCFAIAIVVFSVYSYRTEKWQYQKEINVEIKGIVIDKFRVQKDNPKAVNVRINNSTIYYLPFSLIAEISIGDTIKKEIGNDYYYFYTKSTIIKMSISKPHLWGYPKDWRGFIEIKKREQ